MLYTISVPSKDFKAIEQWLKKGRVLMPEVIGREYESYGNGFVITAKILENKHAVRYTIDDGENIISKVIRSPMCYFGELGITLTFEIDKSYE
jgi:hypothetical protein